MRAFVQPATQPVIIILLEMYYYYVTPLLPCVYSSCLSPRVYLLIRAHYLDYGQPRRVVNEIIVLARKEMI